MSEPPALRCEPDCRYTRWLEASVAKMETLGHRTITTTMNIYAHVMQTQQRDLADRMDEVLAAR